MAPILLRENGLRADERQRVRGIDDDVVSELHPVARQELSESKVGRRRSGRRQDGIEEKQEAPSAREVFRERPGFRFEKGGARSGHDDGIRVGGNRVLSERLPLRHGQVVALEELFRVGVALPALPRVDGRLPVPGGEVDVGRARLGHREDRRRERLFALEVLDLGGSAAHLRSREVEIGELVLLDVFLATARPEDDRVLADSEFAHERFRACQIPLRVELLDLDLRRERAIPAQDLDDRRIEPGVAVHEDRDADRFRQSSHELLRRRRQAVQVGLRPVAARPVARAEPVDAQENRRGESNGRRGDSDARRAAAAHGVSFFAESVTVVRKRKNAVAER